MRLVNGRCQDMKRDVPGQLEDVLAQVGLHRLDVGFGQAIVQLHLFGNHGLALDDQLDTFGTGEIDDIP